MPVGDQLGRLRRLEDKETIFTPVELGPPPPLFDFVARCSIIEKEGVSESGVIPFALWDEQRRALSEFEQHSHVLGVKGRQIGYTWMDLAFWLYKGTFWSNRLFLLARQSEQYAYDAIKRLKILRSTLPGEWRVGVRTDNLGELVFANGCQYLALTATKRIGRGYAAYGGMADEFAFWDWQEEQLAALESACANLHIITTGNGPDLTEKMWNDAAAGRGKYHNVFIPADADPRRTPEWFRLNVEEAAEPRLAKREYAMTPEDAFSAPEGVYFERFDPRRNVQGFEFLRQWQTYVAVDFGWVHAAALFAQLSPTGQLFVYDEMEPCHLTTREFAHAVKERLVSHEAVYTDGFCDPAGQATNVQTAESEVAVFAEEGVPLSSVKSGVRDGCLQVIHELAAPDGLQLIIHPRCEGLRKALTKVKPDKNRPDIYDDKSDFAHILDACRYLVVNVRGAAGHFDEGHVPRDTPLTAGLRRRLGLGLA